jgi:beta-lactamase class D
MMEVDWPLLALGWWVGWLDGRKNQTAQLKKALIGAKRQ